MAKAAQSGRAEVQMGQLAATKAQSPHVKEFAQRMVSDHTAANQKLLSVAGAEGVTPPKALDAKDTEALQKLKAESGSQFDRGYIRDQVDAHREAVSLFEREAKQSKDAALRQSRSKPRRRCRHLRLAEDLQKR
jgi:putative membrane protein